MINFLKLIFLVTIIGITLISGCVDQIAAPENNESDNDSLSNITSAFNDLPEVQYFLAICPNATINTSFIDEDDMGMSLKDTYLENGSEKSTKAIYMASIHEENGSIISWFDRENNLVGMKVLNPPILEDVSNRLLSSDNLTFNIIKIKSNIYVIFMGGLDADKVDFFTITGNDALGHQFESKIMGAKDGKSDVILYDTAKLEGACYSCWLNFVLISATFTNGERQIILKAQI